MSPRKIEAESGQPTGKHASAEPAELSRRQRRRAEKEIKKAEKQAVKDARKAAKAAAKASRKGGGVVAPVAAATPAQALGDAAPSAPAATTPGPASAAPVSNPESLSQEPARLVPSAITQGQAAEDAPAQGLDLPEIDASAAPAAAPQPMQATADAYEFEEQVAAEKPGSYDDEYGYIPATSAMAYSRYNSSGGSAEMAAEVQANRKRRRRRRVVATVFLVLLCLVGAGAAGAYLYLNNLNQNLAGSDEEAQEVKEALTPAPVGDEPFYMLLVGCDDREGVDGIRADTTILARLDPKANQVTLMSIPRDTAIDIPGYGTQKFNAAYAFNGPSGTIDAASKLCGVDISHYAEVHFESLVDIIDYIGGVDVDVPIPIDDVDAGGKLDAGFQHLNGEQAMIFARSRSYTNGDFQRTTSQRLLIEAAVQKVMSMPPTELPGLLMQVSQCMTTDLSVQQLLGLALAFQDEPDLVMYSAMVPSTTAEYDGVSYVVADTDLLAQMMAVIDAGGDPATVVPDDYTVSTSEEAAAQGIEVIVNTGDDAPDEGAYGAYDYYSGYDGGYYYYGDAGVYGYTTDPYSYSAPTYDDTGYDDGSYGYADDSGYGYDSTYDDSYGAEYYGE